MRASLLAASLLAITTAPVTGQDWRELYDRGEYEKAAAMLHWNVLKPGLSASEVMPDPDAAEMLARLYLRGTGVAQDRILACSFMMLASHTTMFRLGAQSPEHPSLVRTEQLQRETCASLSNEERGDALRMMGCPIYGPDPEVYTLDDGRLVDVTRRGIRVHEGEKQRLWEFATEGCPQRIALVRHARIGARSSRGAARDLFEVFTWLQRSNASEPRRVLDWTLLEVVGDKLEWRAKEQLGDEAGGTWMPAAVPPALSTVHFSMGANGEVKWRFAAAELGGEIDPLPDVEASEPVPPLPTEGTAHVDVTVLDHWGTALPGAAVKLKGVVDREAATDDAGRVTFERLPDGRYEVVASAPQLVSSAPQVIDLGGSGLPPIVLRLKPHARLAAATLACGGYDARNLTTPGSGAGLVLHVKIVDQRTIERAASDPGRPAEMRTSNEVQVLRSFKVHALAPPPGSLVTIVQGGGRIDRGDHIEEHHFNRLPPLNVGDEYVLFLHMASDGTLSILGSEEGAFLIRNGRVDGLGRGGASTTWKGRSAATFFTALQARITR